MEYLETIGKYYSEVLETRNDTFRPHIHDDLEIVYILTGERTVLIDSHEYPEPTGSLTLVFPFQLHGYLGGSGQHNVICVNPQYLFGYCDILLSCIPSEPVLRADMLPERAAKLLSVLMDTTRPKDQTQANALITALLAELFEPLGLRQRGDCSMSNEILPIVSKHCRESAFSLTALSKMTGIGERTLSDYFTKSFGMSFGSFIRKYRVNLACSMLREAGRPTMTEIAFDCGFSSVRTFNRCFREEYGMSPTDFSGIDRHISQNGETTTSDP